MKPISFNQAKLLMMNGHTVYVLMGKTQAFPITAIAKNVYFEVNGLRQLGKPEDLAYGVQ
jgi:hypothetical protein